MMILVFGFWLVCNIVVAKMMSIEEMREDFIENQNFIGKIGANSFYCLAWLLKKSFKRG